MLEEFITDLFMQCVYILQVIGGSPNEFGFGYYLANILIFVVLQPSLIVLFLGLWLREKRSNSVAQTVTQEDDFALNRRSISKE
jgi:hypothetical protein